MAFIKKEVVVKKGEEKGTIYLRPGETTSGSSGANVVTVNPNQGGGFLGSLPRRGGSGGISASTSQQVQQALEEVGLPKAQASAVAREQMLQREAMRRRRGFTRLEAERYLKAGAGSRAVRNLRLGTTTLRRSGLGGVAKNLYEQILERERPREATQIQRANQSINLNLRVNPKASFPKPVANVYKKIYRSTYNILDKFSGGKLTNKKLDKLQEQLDKRVDDFNKQYNENQSLDEKSYAVANSIQQSLLNTQSAIDSAREGSKKPLQDLIEKTSSRSTGGKLTAEKIIKTLRGDFTTSIFNKRSVQSQGLGVANALANFVLGVGGGASTVKQIYKNPTAFVKGLKNVPSSIKSSVLKNAKLYSINPQFTVAKIVTSAGLNYYTFKATNDGLKITGKLTKKGIVKLTPFIKRTTPRDVELFFGGVQYSKKGKIITDVTFKSLGKEGSRIGVVRGVTSKIGNLGSKGRTLTVGSFGRAGVLFPTGRLTIKKIRSFFGIEKGISKKAIFKVISKEKLRSLNSLRKLAPSKLNRLSFKLSGLRLRKSRVSKVRRYKKIVKDAVNRKKGIYITRTNTKKLFLQLGLGRVVTARGLKFIRKGVRFPTGKIISKYKRFDVNDFASISGVLTKGQLSKIVGKTITSEGGKANFFGLIKRLQSGKIIRGFKGGGRSLGTISKSKQLQYSVALRKVVSVVSASLSKTSKVKGLSKFQVNTRAIGLIGNALANIKGKVTTGQIIREIKRVSPLQVTQSKLPSLSKTLVASKQFSRNQSRLKNQSAQLVRQSERIRSGLSSVLLSRLSSRERARLKVLLKASQGQSQRSRQALRTLLKQPLIQKQILTQVRPRLIPTPVISRIIFPKFRGFKFSRGKKFGVRKLSKAIPTFNVYAKSGKKFVKINKGGLSRIDALSRGTFAIDNTTAKTFKITPAGRRKTIYSIPKQEKNYYNRGGYKLREYRIKRGRKFGILPKYIEKRKYGIDTRGEKRGLTISRYLKGYGKGGSGYVRKRHIRISAQRRKQLLKNLVKARRVLQRRRR